ncbi:putative 2OG-Fe(II) oxygenase [Rhizobiales bacterium GAS191]|nr:putative 2OG-Fe(II) oxygenase [Rhizobiales bacterium GAS191]
MPPETQPEPEALLRKLSESGFVKLCGLLNQDQARAVKREAERLLAKPSVAWDHYSAWAASGLYRALLFAGLRRDTALFDFIGKSPLVDEAIEAALSSPVVQHLLVGALGSGYRIWYNQVRRANPGGRALRMHQDRLGEMSLSILLSDTPSPAGTTGFLPRSHRWPRVLESFPLLSPHYIRNKLVGATGVPGDAYLFYNATWHGRLRSDEVARTSMFVSFLPRNAGETQHFPPADMLQRLGPSLRRAWSGEDAEPVIPPATEELRQILNNSLPVRALSPWHVVMAVSSAWEAAHHWVRRVMRIMKRQ